MKKQSHLDHRYVEFIPKEIDGGVLYISERFNTASHLCCCGCGFKVITPLNAAKWHLTDHGTSVSLSPSVGLGAFPCRSHYWIRRGRVDWYPNMTKAGTHRAQRRDDYAMRVHAGEIKPPPLPGHNARSKPESRPSFWARTKDWWRSLWR